MTGAGACISKAYGGMSPTFLAAVIEHPTEGTGRREGGEGRKRREGWRKGRFTLVHSLMVHLVMVRKSW